MMIFSLVAMIGLENCCITSACLQWLCHSGERIVARGPLVFSFFFFMKTFVVGTHWKHFAAGHLVRTIRMLIRTTEKKNNYLDTVNVLRFRTPKLLI